MRIPITLVIEMTEQQVENYADEYGLPRNGAGTVMAKDIVDDVRSYVLTEIQGSAAFGEGCADVSIKR